MVNIAQSTSLHRFRIRIFFFFEFGKYFLSHLLLPTQGRNLQFWKQTLTSVKGLEINNFDHSKDEIFPL